MENQYYRTFIGLPVKVGPGVLKSRLQLMHLLSGERISWVDPERFHITLRFIGDTMVTDISIDLVGTAFFTLAIDMPGHEYKLDRHGSFAA